MSCRVLLIDDGCDLHLARRRLAGGYAAVICLFWAAPETRRELASASGGFCWDIRDVSGGLEAWEEKSYLRVRHFCGRGPSHDGLPWREALLEPLYREMLLFSLMEGALEAATRLAGGGGMVVEHSLAPAYRRALELLAPERCPAARLVSLEGVRPRCAAGGGRPGRLHGRLREVMLTGGAFRHGWHLLDQLDAGYGLRCGVSRLRGLPPVSRGGVTFVSSYYNNSRVLKSLEKDFPGPVDWILTNRSASEGALPFRGSANWLWRFHPGAGRVHPGRGDTGAGEGPDGAVRTWLEESPHVRRWADSGRLTLSRLTACFEAYLDLAAPRLVAVASQWGGDGWLARIARRRGIPVVQVMHGVLGGHLYTRTALESDLFVVPGGFWKELWPEGERERIIVYNPGDVLRTPEAGRAGRRLTFFSWPLEALPFLNAGELLDGIIGILDRLATHEGVEITVHAHPAENPAELVSRWKRLRGELPRGLKVLKHADMGNLLAETDAALMFRSTVMLDCMAHGVPVVMPGWIDFGWNRHLEGLDCVALAENLGGLETDLRERLLHPGRRRDGACERFMDEPGAGRTAFRRALERLSA